MAVRQIDMEMLISNAYYCKKNFSFEQYKNQTVDLLYQGFYNFDFDGGPVLDKYREKYADPAFRIVHHLVVFFVYDNGSLYQSEYDVYCKLCEKCGHKYFSLDQLLKFRKDLTRDDLKGLTSFIRLLREHINESFFQNFIYGLVMLALLDNGELSELAYCGIQSVLKPGFDNCPDYRTIMSRVYKMVKTKTQLAKS